MYKSLGGNGLGEELFNLVQDKYSGQMMQKDQIDLLSKVFRPNACNPNVCRYVPKAEEGKHIAKG